MEKFVEGLGGGGLEKLGESRVADSLNVDVTVQAVSGRVVESHRHGDQDADGQSHKESPDSRHPSLLLYYWRGRVDRVLKSSLLI